MGRRLSIVLVSSLALLGACRDRRGEHEPTAAHAHQTADPAGAEQGPARHLHDMRPRHRGSVAVLGTMLVEITATSDGEVRAYLSDGGRHPISPIGVTATVTMSLPSGDRTVTIVPVNDVLEGRTTPFDVESATAHVSMTRDGRTSETTMLLDFTGRRAGVAGVPAGGCAPPGRAADTGRAPRCTAMFSSAFTALGATRDGSRIVLALSHGTTSVWSLPAATLVMGLEPAPPVPLLAGQHEPDARVLSFRPDGAEIAVALGDRLVVYDAQSGRVARELRAPGGSVQAIAWLPDGKRLAVATAGDGKARLVEAGAGDVLRVLAIDGHANVVAADSTGRLAVGTDVGTIALVDGAGAAMRVLTPSLQPVASIACAGELLVSAGTDGTLRVFDVAAGSETARVDVGTPLVLLAIAPNGGHAASADAQRVLRVHRLPSGEVVEQLAWHRATVSVLGWGAGNTLVSGDNDGTLAVWELETSPP